MGLLLVVVRFHKCVALPWLLTVIYVHGIIHTYMSHPAQWTGKQRGENAETGMFETGCFLSFLLFYIVSKTLPALRVSVIGNLVTKDGGGRGACVWKGMSTIVVHIADGVLSPTTATDVRVRNVMYYLFLSSCLPTGECKGKSTMEIIRSLLVPRKQTLSNHFFFLSW